MTTPERLERVKRIAAAFNDMDYEANGLPMEILSKDIRNDIVRMLHEPRRDQGNRLAQHIGLALEVSEIVQRLATEHAKQYFHRVLQTV